MNRKIAWDSARLDEIELVYEKAAEDANIGALLEKLEAQALEEAKNLIGMFRTKTGKALRPEEFDTLTDTDKELVICALGAAGLTSFNTELKDAAIIADISPAYAQACTIFTILNRLEKLDGAVTLLSPKWTLRLRIPLGGRKGLSQWGILILLLYPWLTVEEEALTVSATSEASPEKSPRDPFLEKMNSFKAFQDAYAPALAEAAQVIEKQPRFLSEWNDNLSIRAWKELNENEKFQRVLSLGLYGIVIDHVVCVDFSEHIPNCIAIALLYLADSGKEKNQVIDAGDGTDTKKLVNAIEGIYGCCKDWKCVIMHPVVKEFKREAESGTSGPVCTDFGKQKKKSLWKKLFG